MGGPNAPVTIDKSVEGMVNVLDTIDVKCTGNFKIMMERNYLAKARATWIFL
mgnify:CR=1 FL=1